MVIGLTDITLGGEAAMMKSIVGGILMAVGAFFVLGFTITLSKAGFGAGDVMGLFLLGLGPIAGGGAMIRSHIRAKQHALQAHERDVFARREKEIIQLAQARRGRLSIPDIVAGTSLSTADAEAVMRDMTTKGYVDMQVTDAGVIVYEFYEIAHRQPLAE
jgi:hypothetical protein